MDIGRLYKQLHIVLECLPNEKIITFSNCSVSSLGPVSDKKGLACVRRAWCFTVLPNPNARLLLFMFLNSQPSTLRLLGLWEWKTFLKGGKRGEKHWVQHREWEPCCPHLGSDALLLCSPEKLILTAYIFLTLKWDHGGNLLQGDALTPWAWTLEYSSRG